MDARDSTETFRQPDDAAKRTLLERHLDGLRRFVRARLGNSVRTKETSLDLAQSVCREALEDFDGFEYRGDVSFRNWLHLRAENKIRDRARYWSRMRRETRREIPLEAKGEARDVRLQSFCTPSRQAASREELARLEQAFLGLAPQEREVIALVRLSGLSHEEAARRMGRTPLATRSMLSRALARLATRIERP